MNLAIIQVIKGINFHDDEGELQFRVTWGEEEATMESVCNTVNVAVRQEVAFQISKDDRRVLNVDPLHLQCTYTSSDGTECYIVKIELPFEFNTESNQKWYELKTETDVDNLGIKPSLLVSLFCETATTEDGKPVLVNDETIPAPRHVLSSVSSKPVKTDPDSSIERHRFKEDLIYATALELEVWKEEQKLLEREKQKRSISSYMELLNNEYRRQAALKEAALERRVRRVEELEKQLEEVIRTARQSELELQQEK